jgi:twinkle protein
VADGKKGADWADAEIARKPRGYSARGKGEALRKLWDEGLAPGSKTGWPSLDKHYTVAPGQFTVITGWPGAGKSEWLDALLINLMRQGWRLAVFSPENMPGEVHLSKLIEKIAGKPFRPGPTPRLGIDELAEYEDELDSAFWFIEAGSGAVSAQSVILAAEPWFAQFPDNRRGLVLDPWNELEHWRAPGMSETEHISMTLSLVRNWARTQDIHVWIVAHPQKMRREDSGKLPIPKPDMISGSSHWWNKSDNAITVYRDLSDLSSRVVDIYVHKVRFKHIGTPGMVSLTYDRVTGRYFEQRQPELYRTKGEGE